MVFNKIINKIIKVDKDLFDEETMAKVVFKGILGKHIFHNPETKLLMVVEPGSVIPEGFIRGNGKTFITSELTKQKISEAHTGKVREYKFNNTNVKGRIYFHNPETGVVIMIKPTDIIPEGFIKGRGFSPTKGMKMSDSCKQLKSEQTSSTRWFHNPDLKINKRIKIGDIIPDGFITGRLKNQEDFMNN